MTPSLIIGVTSPLHSRPGSESNRLFATVMMELEKHGMEKHDPDDPVAVYIREVGNIETLTKDEETKLFQELGHKGNSDKTRDIVARRLIESRLALVVSVAQKHSASGVPMLELIQEGNLGLLNAMRSFSERPIGDFTTYAATCIEDAITRTLGKSK